MDTTTFLWTLSATIFGGLQLFFQKIVAEQGRSSALNGALMYGVSGCMALGTFLVSFSIPDQWRIIFWLAIAGGLIHSLGNFIRIDALRYIDSVIYFPINKVLGPLVVVIGGLTWFGDPLTLREYVGIGLSLCVPLLLIAAREHKRQKDLRKGLVLLVLSTVLTSFSMLAVKEGSVRSPDVLFMMVIINFFATVTSLAVLYRQEGKGVPSLKNCSRQDLYLGSFAGVLGFFSFYSLLKAYTTGFVSIVYVIHAHYILIPILLSVIIYKEHMNMRKFSAIVLSVLAITLLY
jgi:drug/metabolite transporter (DMT)-like permease